MSATRVYPVAEDELPILLVYLGDEEIEGHTMGGAIRRTAQLVVEIRAKGAFVDQDLEALLAGVETTLNRSTLGGLTRPLVPEGITMTVDATNTPIGTARVTYRAVYQTDFSNPQVAL